jgi:hypothetical protein
MRGGVQTERSGTDATTPSSGAHTGRISAAKTVDVMPRRSALGSSGAHGDLAMNARAVFGSRATSGPRDARQTVKRPWRRPDRCRRSFCAISPTSWLSSNNCWLSIAQPQPTSHRKPRAGRTVFPRGTAGAVSRIPEVLRRLAVLAADAMRRRAPIRQVRGAGGRCVHLRSPPSRGWKSHLVRSRCVRCRSMRRRLRMRFNGICQSRPARHRATRASRSPPTRPRRARRSRAGS